MDIIQEENSENVVASLSFDDCHILKVVGKKGDKGDPGETIVGPPGPEGKPGKSIPGNDGKDGSPDTPQQIADKLNSLEEILDFKVLKGIPDFTPYEKRLGLLEKTNTLNPKGPVDLRWRGGGLSSVTHDSTLTGLGTPASPLSVASSGSIPTGVMMNWAGSIATVPTGALFCNGASLLRAGTFAALFAKIGTIWGSADGTHFNIPDSRDRVAVGASTDVAGIPKTNVGGSTNQCGGNDCHFHTVAPQATQGHVHTATLSGSGGTTDQGFANIGWGCGSVDNNGLGSTTTAVTSFSGDSGHTHSFSGLSVSGTTDSATDTTCGGNTSTELNVMRFLAVPSIIFI